MCIGCYEEAGKPLPDAIAVEVGRLMDAEVNPFGGCHIVVEDWNLEDNDIDYCLANKCTSEREAEIMRALKALSMEQRNAAMAVSCGYA